MQSTPCPSCGASVGFQSAASILAICEFCRSTLVRHDLDVENVGTMAELLVDGSPIQLRVEGVYRSSHFAVVGRIQLRYGSGLWNEWHLLFDDMRTGWLGEAQGIYAISFLTEVSGKLPSFDDLSIGRQVQLQNRSYEVRDLQMAYCVGGEGELPFQVGAGYEAPVADLAGDEDRFATIDYSEDSPLVFIGEYMGFEALRLTGLREFDGW